MCFVRTLCGDGTLSHPHHIHWTNKTPKHARPNSLLFHLKACADALKGIGVTTALFTLCKTYSMSPSQSTLGTQSKHGSNQAHIMSSTATLAEASSNNKVVQRACNCNCNIRLELLFLVWMCVCFANTWERARITLQKNNMSFFITRP
jgi:hypothetical protein